MSDPLLDHDYDGIQEYDNPMPFWWKGIFALTAAFSVGYVYWYHLGGPGPSMHEEYVADLKELNEVRAAAAAKQPIVVDEAALAAMAEDDGALERGQSVFQKNCVSCHAEDGRGLVGPNLTDRYQIHGIGRADIHRTIYQGVPSKGMLAWGEMLPPADVAAVAVYVAEMRGRDVPGGKPPEGQPVDGPSAERQP